jgi:hypothetical protein
MDMAAMKRVSTVGFSGVVYQMTKCPQGVACPDPEETPVFGVWLPKLGHMTVTGAKHCYVLTWRIEDGYISINKRQRPWTCGREQRRARFAVYHMPGTISCEQNATVRFLSHYVSCLFIYIYFLKNPRVFIFQNQNSHSLVQKAYRHIRNSIGFIQQIQPHLHLLWNKIQ